MNIHNLLTNTTNKSHYNGWFNTDKFTAGYHSHYHHNLHITGQRNCKKRIELISKYINFKDRTVLDLGCNTGGMLFELSTIKKGIGYDYDIDCIKCANYIKNYYNINNLLFGVCDFNRNPLPNINNFDIILLCSLGSWVYNWRNLYKKCMKSKSVIIFETNNDKEGKAQLDFFKLHNYCNSLIINNLSDNSGNNKRKTYILKPWIYIVHTITKTICDFFKKYNIIPLMIKGRAYLYPEDTIHYYCLTKNTPELWTMYGKYVKESKQQEHSIENFRNLIENFDIKKIQPITLKQTYNITYIHDGVHRYIIFNVLNNYL